MQAQEAGETEQERQGLRDQVERLSRQARALRTEQQAAALEAARCVRLHGFSAGGRNRCPPLRSSPGLLAWAGVVIGMSQS